MNGQGGLFGYQPAPHHRHDPAPSELDAANLVASTLREAQRACLQAVDAGMSEGQTTRAVERLVYPWQPNMDYDTAYKWATSQNKVGTRLGELEKLGLVETRRDKDGKRVVRAEPDSDKRFLVYWTTGRGRLELAK